MYKHRIDNLGNAVKLLDVNGAETNVAADVVTVNILGTASFPVANIKSAHGVRAKDGVPFSNVITIASAAQSFPMYVTLKLELVTQRPLAKYSRYAYNSGSTLVFSTYVAPGKTAAQIASMLKGEIQARIDKYNDLPFTVSVSGANITLNGLPNVDYLHVKLGYKPVNVTNVNDGTNPEGVVTASEVLTPEVEAINSGAWVEENVAMDTIEAVRLGAARSDEAVIRNAKYTSIYMEVGFTSDEVPMPAPYGENSLSGSYNLGLYLNEAVKPKSADDTYAVLVEVLSGISDSSFVEENGTPVEGATGAEKSDDFWGMGLTAGGDQAAEA